MRTKYFNQIIRDLNNSLLELVIDGANKTAQYVFIYKKISEDGLAFPADMFTDEQREELANYNQGGYQC